MPLDVSTPPRVANSGRSFDFARYRVRLEARHGDTGVPELVAWIVAAIEQRQERDA